jgi:hypothetical protein
MALTVWTQRSGYSFGIFQERSNFNQLLPVENDTDVSYSVISGELPPGLRINGNHIIGTPFEVSRETIFSFCIRATRNFEISDRTFDITIEGADAPTFTTAAGNLDIGLYRQYFVLDSTYVEYQIEAFDYDTATGQHLSFFIADDEGELPPGLTLTEDGRLVGFVKPVISIKPEDGNGNYDTGYYDVVAYDFGLRSTNGYDSYIYDTVDFDFSLPAFRPKKLNRNYQFTITITDGDSIAKRTFSIFVVGDDYFRADNATMITTTGIFTADVSYLRAPIWVTKSYLGLYRANNYLVLFLDTYDKNDLVTFSVAEATQEWLPLTSYAINDLIVAGDKTYICISAHTSGLSIDTTKWGVYGFPPGMTFDYDTAEVYGRIPYQPAITETYRFTIIATRFSDDGVDSAYTPRTFTVQLVGEIDSVLTWNTPADLGSINANYVVNLKVQATSTITNAVMLYKITAGSLPNGLTLALDGEIIGTVNQFSNNLTNTVGLTTFDYTMNTTVFDGGNISFDRLYNVTIEARDRSGYSAIERTFTILVATPNQIAYSNIRTKPLLKISQRDMWKNFINDNSIFTSASIYRLNDSNFGVQTELSMVVYAGIETTDAAKYVGAMGLNHKRKRFQFGTVKKATAVNTGTTDQIYEVIYIEMIDPLEPNNKRLPMEITRGLQTPVVTVDNSTSLWSRTLDELSKSAPAAPRPNPLVTVDSRGYMVSNPNPNTYFPNSISNWRDRLKMVGETERNYLPLWMRSIQPGTKTELGFTLAVPLCYCKVGMADDIILNIKYSGFDFKMLDYTTDRFIIDAVDGDTSDKYLVFKNDRITI